MVQVSSYGAISQQSPADTSSAHRPSLRRVFAVCFAAAAICAVLALASVYNPQTGRIELAAPTCSSPVLCHISFSGTIEAQEAKKEETAIGDAVENLKRLEARISKMEDEEEPNVEKQAAARVKAKEAARARYLKFRSELKQLTGSIADTVDSEMDLQARFAAIGARGNEGPRGPPGRAGPPGPAGYSGVSGPGGPMGQPGLVGSPGLNGVKIMGPAGKRGARGKMGNPGQPGTPGKAGVQGPHGIPGVNGHDGVQGRDGARGKWGIPGNAGKNGISGPPGPPGFAGFPGDPGNDGVRGRDGKPGVEAA